MGLLTSLGISPTYTFRNDFQFSKLETHGHNVEFEFLLIQELFTSSDRENQLEAL